METLHRLRPGFLKRFKNIHYIALDSTLPSKFMDLSFGIFVSRQTTSLPNSITKLELRDCDFDALANILELKLTGVDVDFDDLKQMRYLRKLTLVNYEEDVVINHPTLVNLALKDHKGQVDISGCVKLADFESSFQVDFINYYCGPKKYSLGFGVNDTYRLPPNLIFLLLEKVPYSPTLENLSQFESLQFIRISLSSMYPTRGIINVPANLLGLLIEGGAYEFNILNVSCNIPQTLTYLELINLKGVGDFRLPESLVYLDLEEFHYCQHDYSHLKNLRTIHPSKCRIENCSHKLKLPLQIENYKRWWGTDREHRLFSRLHHLESSVSLSVSKFCLPDLMKLLRVNLDIHGGSNLQQLIILVSINIIPVKFNFKNLTSLYIESHVNKIISDFILPETLQYLSLHRVVMKTNLISPPGLKFLSLVDCKLRIIPILDDELEVLELDSVCYGRAFVGFLDVSKLLKDPPKSLKHLYLKNWFWGKRLMDLRYTQLETLLIQDCIRDSNEKWQEIKLPKTLKEFKYSVNPNSPLKIFDLFDISECDHLCGFRIPNFESEDPKAMERFRKFEGTANVKINLLQ